MDIVCHNVGKFDQINASLEVKNSKNFISSFPYSIGDKDRLSKKRFHVIQDLNNFCIFIGSVCFL